MGCTNCTRATDCTNCVANNNTRANASQSCACLDGFYETGAPICPRCSVECKTCSGSPTNCDTCFEESGFVKQGTTCTCSQGSYFLLVDNIPRCLRCDSSCANCSGDPTRCIACKSADWTRSGDTCICNKFIRTVTNLNGSVERVCVDNRCPSIHPECTQCSILLPSGQAICRQCNDLSNTVLSGDNTTCVCRLGFFN